jgi:hypothetical protein
MSQDFLARFPIPGSARFQRALFGILPKKLRREDSRQDAANSTLEAWAPRKK